MRGYTYSSLIRSFCLDCMGFSAGLVAKCQSKTCIFYPYRFAKTPYPKPALSALQSIGKKCLECVGTPEDVIACTNLDCSVHIYRNRKPPPLNTGKTRGVSEIPSKLSSGPEQLSLI